MLEWLNKNMKLAILNGNTSLPGRLQKEIKTAGVYAVFIENVNKAYIGYTSHLYKRRIKHIADLRNNEHENSKLQEAFNNSGSNDIIFYYIEIEDEEAGLDYEQFIVDSFWDSGGLLNLSRNTRCPGQGIIYSKERLLAMSNTTKQRYINNPELREQVSNVTKEQWSNPNTRPILIEKALPNLKLGIEATSKPVSAAGTIYPSIAEANRAFNITTAQYRIRSPNFPEWYMTDKTEIESKVSKISIGGLDETRGIVCYTDGGAKPNPGFIGWGAHGYMYEIKELKKSVIVENHYVTSTGYINCSLKDAGMPVFVEPVKYFDFFGSSYHKGSNNFAEVLALNSIMVNIEKYNVKNILILTDSEYLRNGITDWCANWSRNGWKKQDGNSVSNWELWEDTYNRVKAFKALGGNFTISWVKAHSGVFGNTHADIFASIGVNYSTSGIMRNECTVSEPKGYWKSEVDRHPFINFKRIYFNSVEKFNIKGNYFQADPGGSDFTVGKRIPETGFAVIKLTEPDVVIETIKARQCEVANDLNAIIMMKLDEVFDKNKYHYLASHGKHCLLSNRQNLNLNFVNDDKSHITVEVNPTGLSLRAIESFNLLEDLLSDFINATKNSIPKENLSVHDITHVFYETIEKKVKKEVVIKHELKETFVVGFRDMMITIDEPYNGSLVKVQVPLILGTDLLPRNSLKRLEDSNPKIYLITWRESPNSIRYATVIECNTGIGIWSNFYADKIFFH